MLLAARTGTAAALWVRLGVCHQQSPAAPARASGATSPVLSDCSWRSGLLLPLSAMELGTLVPPCSVALGISAPCNRGALPRALLGHPPPRAQPRTLLTPPQIPW